MAVVAKRPALPVILLANDLLDGDVVFAAAALSGNKVVDAYLVDVAIESGSPVPRHFRERFKTLGPSNRPDLGKQAGEGIAATPKG